EGRTTYQDGFYHGERIKKIDERTLNVRYGYYTTCDREADPHFYFKSRKMKLIAMDKVIARPVVMYIQDVPVMALPYGIFPNRGGRHSGFILPTYGKSQKEGRYLRGMGYYWAPSEYWDSRLLVDFFDRTGFLFRSLFRYSKRYILNGSISGSMTRKSFQGRMEADASSEKIRRWDLKIRHNQVIDPTMKFNINASFVSDGSFYERYSTVRNQRLKKQLISNATLTKTWEGTKNSMTVNLSKIQDLTNGNYTETLPQVNFRRGTSQIFPSESPDKKDLKWYNSIYYSYSSNLVQQKEKKRTSKLTEEAVFQYRFKREANHSINLNSPQKLLGWLTLKPSLNYRETWRDKYYLPVYDSRGRMVLGSRGEILAAEKRGFKARRSYSLSANASTKIYGIFNPNMGTLKSVRHVVTPNVSLSYNPGLSGRFFGYYIKGVDVNGKDVIFDTFQGRRTGAAVKARRYINFNLSNLFQAKIVKEEKERKIELFNLNFSSSYAFDDQKFKLKPLNTSFRTTLPGGLGIDLRAVHDFYTRDLSGIRINRINRGFPRLTDLNLSASFRLTGAAESPGAGYKAEGGEAEAAEEPPEKTMADPDQRFEQFTVPEKTGSPWDLNLSIRYALSRADPDNPRKTLWLNTNLQFYITRKWSVKYDARFNLMEKSVVNHDLSFYRDLHCWEFIFNWTPSGPGAGYYLRINIKSPQLRDIKIEERGGRSSVLGY
ncbi:MAG: LPS assembly protein LptD, partial [Fidelibacterota bacterium]